MARPASAWTPRSGQQGSVRSRTRPHKPWPARLTIGLLAFILPVCGILQALLVHNTKTPLLLYSTLSALSFVVYGFDKSRASNAGWRVRETLLHVLDLVGGWPGGFLAQHYFKHKTRKTSFQLIFWATVLVHQWFCFRQVFLPQGTDSQRLDS